MKNYILWKKCIYIYIWHHQGISARVTLWKTIYYERIYIYIWHHQGIIARVTLAIICIYIYSIMKWNPWFWGPLTSRHLHTIFPKRRFKIKFHVFPSSAMPPGFDGRSGNHFTSWRARWGRQATIRLGGQGHTREPSKVTMDHEWFSCSWL